MSLEFSYAEDLNKEVGEMKKENFGWIILCPFPTPAAVHALANYMWAIKRPAPGGRRLRRQHRAPQRVCPCTATPLLVYHRGLLPGEKDSPENLDISQSFQEPPVLLEGAPTAPAAPAPAARWAPGGGEPLHPPTPPARSAGSDGAAAGAFPRPGWLLPVPHPLFSAGT